MIVRCSRQEFDDFLDGCSIQEEQNEEMVVGICEYLKMNNEERRQAWVNEQEAAKPVSTAHLNFLANP